MRSEQSVQAKSDPSPPSEIAYLHPCIYAVLHKDWCGKTAHTAMVVVGMGKTKYKYHSSLS